MTQVWNLTRLDPQVDEIDRLDDQQVCPGEWRPLSDFNKRLENIARNIDPRATTLDTVKAVPDPWAHPRTFAEAVRVESHPLHAICVGQWRWLLAVIGLSGIREHVYRLEFVPLDMAASSSRSSKLLSELAPTRTLWNKVLPGSAHRDRLSEATWANPVLVRLIVEDEAKTAFELGFLNPASLVTSGRRYAGVKPASVDMPAWMAGGIADPTENLQTHERQALGAYLDELMRRLDDLLGATEDTDWGRLRPQISDFMDSCGGPSIAPEWKDLPTEAPLPSLYEPLVHVPCERLDATECLIAGTNLMLADATIANTLKKRPGTVAFWRNFTLASLHKLHTITQVENGLCRLREPPHYRVVTVDDLLTDLLCEVKNADEPITFPKHGPSLTNCLLPVHSLVLQFIKPNEMAKAINRKDNLIELTVQLARADGSTIDHTIQRSYDRVEKVRCIDDQIAMWPDFKATGWGDYYVRLLHGKGDVPAGSILLPFEASTLNPAPDTDSASSISDKPVVSRFSEPAAAVFCALSNQKAEVSPYVGMLLLPDLRDLPDRASEGVKVAVDFGTTGTIAMVEHANDPVAFHERVVQPLGRSASFLHLYAQRAIDFFPVMASEEPDRIAQRMPSVSAWLTCDYWPLHKPNAGGSDVRGASLFMPLRREVEAWELATSRVGDIVYNLKWDVALKNIAQIYLEHLGLMIRAELAEAGLHPRQWIFSFPRSLEHGPRSMFCDGMEKSFGPTVPDDPNAKEPKVVFISEDEAAARSVYDTVDETTVILDIGGMTTDVTMIQRRGSEKRGFSRVWQGSLKLAGLTFFTRVLSEDAELRAWLGLESWDTVLDGVTDDRKRPFRIELLMNGPQLNEQLKEKWGYRSEIGAADGRLETAALIFLGGISWYLGLTAARSASVDIAMLQRVVFKLCGRGSRFPMFLQQQKPGRAERALGLFHVAAAISNGTVEIGNVEGQAKEEVVRGALDSSNYRKGLLGGEPDTDLWHGVEVVADMDRPQKVGDPIPSGEEPIIKGQALDAFLEAMKTHVGVNIEVGQLAGSIEALTGKRGIDLNVEPAFLIVLRWLIETIASPKECNLKKVHYYLT